MKKDIDFPIIKDVQVAIAREASADNAAEWGVYLINRKQEPLTKVFVTSSGYNEEDKTSTLRHFIQEVPPLSFTKVERIEPEVFKLTNEFWVSFWVGGQLFDKRYIFAADSIIEENFQQISLLELLGIAQD